MVNIFVPVLRSYRLFTTKELNIVVPVLSSYRLFITKELQFNNFKASLQVQSTSDTLLGQYKTFISGLIFDNSYIPTTYKVMPSKLWLVGYIEAEGSFYITRHRERYVHCISLGQKKDRFLLEKISFMGVAGDGFTVPPIN